MSMENIIPPAFRSGRRWTGLALVVGLGVGGPVAAQVPTFGGNAQHTSLYSVPAQHLSRIRWTADIDLNNSGQFAHYGAPLITAANTVITPVKTAGNGFQILALQGSDGAVKYTLNTDYILPSAGWIPVYQPVLTTGPAGPRLYYPGPGGMLWHIDNADSVTPGAPVGEVFYTSRATYEAGAAGYKSTVFINTPITAGTDGTVYFGFRVQGTAPAPLSTTQSGFARVDAAGTASYVLASTAANDVTIGRDSHNSAPALSADGTTLYVVVKPPASDYGGYLLGLDTATLATKYRVFLRDPRNNNPAGILDLSTASPMVAPDGDVYLGVFGNPGNGSRGFLLRFTGDLAVQKTPGGFGWDYTPAIVPAGMVPSYTGSSSYLLFAKYNNYAYQDGDGVNRIAILDPNATQTDPHTSAPGLVEMREVLTVIGPTRDDENPAIPLAVREWCINAPAIDSAHQSVLVPSEDGHIYRWNLADNSLTETLPLSNGVGQPYVPTVIGPDGTIYTLNGGTLFALGDDAEVNLSLTSSLPDQRQVVVGTPITFTATVTGSPPSTPTGTVTFLSITRDGLNPVSSVLAADVPLDANGRATVTTAALPAGGNFLGSHFIAATYSGDGTYPGASAQRVQKIHALATTTGLSIGAPASFGQPVELTATVTAATGVPTGMVTFYEGTTILGQRPLNGSGACSLTLTGLSAGSHSLSAIYASDTHNAASTGSLVLPVAEGTSTTLAVTPNPAGFGTPVSVTATVLAADIAAGIPTGTVTVQEGASTLGTVAVDGTGVAVLSLTTLPTGAHPLTATFTGSSGWGNSSGSAPTLNITDGTTTTLAGSPNPAVFGQSVAFTATVAPAHAGAGIPAGSVAFTEGVTTLGIVVVDITGKAALNLTSLTIGAHVITATFTGANGWGNSSGSAVTQNITDGTTTALAAAPNPSAFGQLVTFTASIAAAHAGAGVPTGSVVFKEGVTTLGTVAVDVTGKAILNRTNLPAGAHNITANFTGVNGWGNSSGAAPTLTITDGTTTTVAAAPNPSAFGQSVAITATITAAHTGAGIPTGSVAFKEGATTLGTVTVDGAGKAILNLANLITGPHALTATFTGANGWGNSSGSAPAINITDGTTTALAASPNPSAFGQSVTFTATVAATHATAGTPTGSVTFRRGTTVLGSSPLNASRQAALTLSTLPSGANSITASFVGTGGWGNSTATLSQTVQPDTTPPSVPGNVTATTGPARRAITLGWTASTDVSGIAQYQVYRSTTQAGVYSLIGSVNAPTTTYVDTLASSGQVRWYYVVAVDTVGNRSAASAKVQGRSR